MLSCKREGKKKNTNFKSEILCFQRYNTELLRQLRARIAKFHAGLTVGDIFLNMRHFSSIYSAFLTGYDHAMETVQYHQQNNPPLAKVIRSCEKQMGNTIESFLILPVQRIPRYMLLLQVFVAFLLPVCSNVRNFKAVMHETDKKHPDYALCQQAAEKMEKVSRKFRLLEVLLFACSLALTWLQVGSAVNERRREMEAEQQRAAQLRALNDQIFGLKVPIIDDNRR